MSLRLRAGDIEAASSAYPGSWNVHAGMEQLLLDSQAEAGGHFTSLATDQHLNPQLNAVSSSPVLYAGFLSKSKLT